MLRCKQGKTSSSAALVTSTPKVTLISKQQEKEGLEECYQTLFLKAIEERGEQQEIEFFRKLDNEFNKVNGFFKKKVNEVMEEAGDLSKQMNALITLRAKVDKVVGFKSSITNDPYSSRNSASMDHHINDAKPHEVLPSKHLLSSFNSSKKLFSNTTVLPATSCFEQVNRLMDKVESVFIKHFANGNRRKGKETLRPSAKRERHRVTFLLGLLTGCSLALIVTLLVRNEHLNNVGKYLAFKSVPLPFKYDDDDDDEDEERRAR
ncbi:hypothetical protein VNO78_33868 [Psophocarpus tetragonolobus]|uniref:SPX domain-containing protein n=1 Tax=Psophocarpus tetragonolobus TaxID=3891 RepID=A0AAN9P4N2_PSOTE